MSETLYCATDTELASIAGAIRTANNLSSSTKLSWPTDFNYQINQITPSIEAGATGETTITGSPMGNISKWEWVLIIPNNGQNQFYPTSGILTRDLKGSPSAASGYGYALENMTMGQSNKSVAKVFSWT